ncbi:hypothetical protein [Streptomyces roseochromogenus]|uniref:Uncharacterized protein n=1 Tax=Streptomyces roseochromogenus subsp. oscitans DS 12.976 TaxID=1352936 RepID=V6KTF4_STRRC|nr:hypothetical protein [Streptomyces roseochromogenus]EST35298.1 hypothetical protein M878_06285 [Streptomyces roseochromogenus subsp. oscitans DS 12.976]
MNTIAEAWKTTSRPKPVAEPADQRGRDGLRERIRGDHPGHVRRAGGAAAGRPSATPY